jgi:flagellar biosynthesis/type III secretory pathway protein FliH
MTFLALHRRADVTLGTTRWLLNPDEATACNAAVELLERLQALHDRRRAELDAAASQARSAGYLAGRQEAIGQLAPRWCRAWEQAAADSAMQTEALRQAAGSLACQIVQQITADLAPAEVVVSLIRQALRTRPPAPRAVVHVHPDVAAAVAGRLVRSPDDAPRPEWVVQPDASLGLLDCVIQTALGECVAGLQSQLDHIARGLRS